MKKRQFFYSAVFLMVLLLTSSNLYGFKNLMTTDKFEPRFRVELEVRAEDNLKGKITNYLTGELNNFDDVTVVNGDADWKFSIVAKKNCAKGNRSDDILLSIVVSNPFPKKSIDLKSLLINVNVFQAKYLENYFLKSSVLLDHWLRIDSADNLKKMCQGIVTNFNNKHLEKSRQMLRGPSGIRNRQELEKKR